MSDEHRLVVEVLDGPEEGRGERVYPGDLVELAAFGSGADSPVPPQACQVQRGEEGMHVSPMPGTHLRIGPGEPWTEVKRLEGAEIVTEGQLIYLGPIKRGLTIRLLGFRAVPKPVVPVRIGSFRAGVGMAFLAIALICVWFVASSSY